MKEKIIKKLYQHLYGYMDWLSEEEIREELENLADEILALFDENNGFIDGKCKYCGEPAVYRAACSIRCLDGW